MDVEILNKQSIVRISNKISYKFREFLYRMQVSYSEEEWICDVFLC